MTTTAGCSSRSRRARFRQLFLHPGLQLLERAERSFELAKLGADGSLVDRAEQAKAFEPLDRRFGQLRAGALFDRGLLQPGTGAFGPRGQARRLAGERVA